MSRFDPFALECCGRRPEACDCKKKAMTTDTLLTEAANALDNTANCRRCSGDGSIGEDDSERGPVWEDCPECARRNALARQLREREEKAEGLDAARIERVGESRG